MKIRNLIAGMSVAAALIAQQPATPPSPGDVIFRTGTTRVVVPVTVKDKAGRFVSGLTPADFLLLDEKEPRLITEDVASYPISLVVAVQANSTATQILPTIPKVAALFDSLVIGETGELALLAFDHRIQDLTGGFTSDPAKIKAGFAKLKPGSKTSKLNDAAMQAVRMLQNRGRDRKKVLILIGETRDSGSVIDVRDVLTQAEFADVVIYTVSMNHWLNQLTAKAEPNRPNPVPPEGRPPLPMGMVHTGTTDAQTNFGNYTPVFKEIFTLIKGVFIPNAHEVYTKFTGGREQNFVSLGGLEEAVSDIGAELHSQYQLTFAPPSSASGYREIEVRVLTRPDMNVRARQGYWIAPRDAAN